MLMCYQWPSHVSWLVFNCFPFKCSFCLYKIIIIWETVISGQKVIVKLRKTLFSSILEQETAFFDKTRTGELINCLSADTILVAKAVTDNVSDGLMAVVQSVGGIVMMVRISQVILWIWQCYKKNISFHLHMVYWKIIIYYYISLI